MRAPASYEIVPAAANILQDGWSRRDQISGALSVFVAIFVGNAVASLIWWSAHSNQLTNTIITAVALGVVAVLVAIVLLYKLCDTQCGKPVVAFVAHYAAMLFELLSALLLGSAINQYYPYGTMDNVVANLVPFVVMVVIYWIFYVVANRWLFQKAVDEQLARWNNTLKRSEAAQVITNFMHDRLRNKPIYPTLSLFNIRLMADPMVVQSSSSASRHLLAKSTCAS